MRREEFEAHLFRYRATVRYVIDGDTVALVLDLGDSVYRRRNVRPLDINAPEVVGVAGLEAKAFLERLLPPGLAVYVRTHKDRTTFERLLGEVFAEAEPGELRNVGDALVEAGQASRPERR